MQQINQPDDKDEGGEVHALPYDTEGGHQAQLKCRVKGARRTSMFVRGRTGISAPGTRRLLGFGEAGKLGS